MAADEHPEAGAAAAAALLVDLQDEALERDGVVAGHHPFLLVAEDLVEVVTAEGHEGAGRIGGAPA